jgi:hypothetical protein
MTYTANDVQIFEDPLAFIRAHPQMFLAEVAAEDLALNLVRGIVLLNNGPVSLAHFDRWWLVAAEADWMSADAGATAEDVFHRLVPFPEAGPNSIRPEVLLTAFATTVVTWHLGRVTVVKGEVSPDDEIERVVAAHPLWKRWVAFRMDE